MPGLVDMHIHMSPEPGEDWDSTQRALAISLANGVTTARVMSGAPSHPAIRARVEAGDARRAAPLSRRAGDRRHRIRRRPRPRATRCKAAKAAGFDLIKAHGIAKVAGVGGDDRRGQGAGAAGRRSRHQRGRPAARARRAAAGRASRFGARRTDAGGRVARFRAVPVASPSSMCWRQVPAARFAEVARDAKAKGGHFVPDAGGVRADRGDGARRSTRCATGPTMIMSRDWIIADWRAARERLGRMPASRSRRFARDGGGAAADHQGAVRRRRAADGGVGYAAPVPHLGLRHASARSRRSTAAGLSRMAALRSATVVPRDYLRSLPGQGSATGRGRRISGRSRPGARADLLLLDGRSVGATLAALKRIDAVIAAAALIRRPAAQDDAGAGCGGRAQAGSPGRPQ